jgi:P-type Cu2+ transporter
LIYINSTLSTVEYDAAMNSVNTPQSERLSATQHRRADGQWEGLAHVNGMDCGACAVEIERAARQVPGLTEFVVNPASQLGRWVAACPHAIDELVDRAGRLGYVLGLQESAPGSVQVLRNQYFARSRFLRFLVAALCMMQIMMYSAPEYIYTAQEIGLAETGLLRWAQWVLALPLMLYCAAPYFRRGWVATWQGRLVMDQPIVLGLVLAFVLSSLNLNNLHNPVWFDSIGMLLTLLLLVQLLLEKQTIRALNHLASLQPDFPVQVEVPSGDGWKKLAVAQLVAGQQYRLTRLQVVPVDSELVNSESALWVDEAMRTGEVEPVYKHQGELVQAGSRILNPQVLLRPVSLVGGDSLLALGRLLLQALAAKPIHQDKVERVLPWFVLSVLICAAGTALYWGAFQSQPGLAASATVAVLIVTCPCALALALPLVRLFGIRQLADSGVLVRNPQALETLAKVNALALDKTGTLTTSSVGRVQQLDIVDVPGITDSVLLNALCMLARRSVHPVSRAVAAHLFCMLKNNIQPIDWVQVEELPGAGLLGVFRVDQRLIELRLGSAVHCGLLSVQGVSSHAFASCVLDQQAQSLQAVLFLVEFQQDTALGSQLDAFAAQGLCLHMLSGDHLGAVQHWMPEIKFNSRLGGMSPQDKTAWIALQQARKNCVAMVGDGLNDSAAFAQADVSFAAAGASTLSAGQADFLLLKPGMNGLVQAFKTARQVEKIGHQNLLWALSYNGVAVPVAVMGLLDPWMASVGMGLSGLVVFVNALRVNQESR